MSPAVQIATIQLINVLSPQPDPSLPNPSVFTTAYESYRMRKTISNIMVLLFLQHPTGVLEIELPVFYQQCHNEPLVLSDALKHMLSVHQHIVCTRTPTRGVLYTLAHDALPFIVATFDPQTLRAAVTCHIQKILRCYPNGISCDYFQQVFYNMVQIRLSKIVPSGGSWFQFVNSIPSIYCINIRGSNVFIQMDDLDKSAVKTPGDVAFFLTNNLNPNNVLKHCYGYDELLMALFHDTTGSTNFTGVQMEKTFYQLYKCRLVHEAPFIRSKLKGICTLCCAANGVVQYSLSREYVAYMKDNMDGFNAVFQRELKLNPHGVKNDWKRGRLMNDVVEDPKSITKSPFCADHCTVFMGGFCKGDSSEQLQRELAEMGVTVVSCSGILYRSYGWAYVTLLNKK
eukprot:467813_1